MMEKAMNLDRRAALALIGGAAVLPLLPGAANAAAGGFVMWRDPGCGRKGRRSRST